MAKLAWDPVGEHRYETGTDRGVLYPQSADGTYPKGVAWNGLIGVSSSPSGAEPTPLYANNKKYLNMLSAEEYAYSITAYTSPEEFDECDGSVSIAKGVKIGQQPRKTFGFCYRTLIGNDTLGTKYGYTLHIVYGGLAAPSEREYTSVNDSPEALELSWEVSTTPVEVEGFEPTATIDIDSTTVDADKLAALEEILYGSESVEARLPLPDEIVTLIGTAA